MSKLKIDLIFSLPFSMAYIIEGFFFLIPKYSNQVFAQEDILASQSNYRVIFIFLNETVMNLFDSVWTVNKAITVMKQ